MNAWMYDKTGVQRPVIDAGELQYRQRLWATASTEMDNVTTSIDVNRSYVLSVNSSETSAAFDTYVSGEGSARHGTEVYSDAATRFSVAHGEASMALQLAVRTMDATAESGTAQVAQVFMDGSRSVFDRLRLGADIVKRTGEQLRKLEAAFAARISRAYTTAQIPRLPDAEGLRPADDPDRGVVDQTIQDEWAAMTPEERQAVLIEMIRKYAEENGLDPDSLEITFEVRYEYNDDGTIKIDPATGEPVRSGSYGSNSGNNIWINPDQLDNPSPDALHTAVHETQHAVQGEVKGIYEGLSESDKAAIRAGDMPDPFAEYGTNVDEAEVWATNHGEDYISPDESWPDYHAQPLETDARQAGREEGAGMSRDEWAEIKRRAGVP